QHGSRGGGGGARGGDRGQQTAEAEEEKIHPGWGQGPGLLRQGGTFLGKFLSGGDEAELLRVAGRLFKRVQVVKPRSSRPASAERYLLGKGFLLQSDSRGEFTGSPQQEKKMLKIR
ncbi:unnamed protein product, partial [Discosporangium mesarthrocarpum]